MTKKIIKNKEFLLKIKELLTKYEELLRLFLYIFFLSLVAFIPIILGFADGNDLLKLLKGSVSTYWYFISSFIALFIVWILACFIKCFDCLLHEMSITIKGFYVTFSSLYLACLFVYLFLEEQKDIGLIGLFFGLFIILLISSYSVTYCINLMNKIKPLLKKIGFIIIKGLSSFYAFIFRKFFR